MGGGSDDSTKWVDSRPLDSVNYAIHDAKLSSVTTVSRWASHETGIRCDWREQSDHYATDSALAPSLLRAASGSLGSWGRVVMVYLWTGIRVRSERWEERPRKYSERQGR